MFLREELEVATVKELRRFFKQRLQEKEFQAQDMPVQGITVLTGTVQFKGRKRIHVISIFSHEAGEHEFVGYSECEHEARKMLNQWTTGFWAKQFGGAA